MPLDDGSLAHALARLSQAGRVWRCRQCGQTITRHDWLIPMKGEHEHVVFNPAGMIFRLWCFADAMGLRLIGAPSDHFSWFRGYEWTIALCGQCRTHLGWRFDGGAAPDAFYALIIDRLAEGPAE